VTSRALPKQAAGHERVPGSPWLPRAYVPRKLLWSRLDSGVRGAVTMVVAPTGAGKTLGVAGWLQQSEAGRDAIWLNGESSFSVRHLAGVLNLAKRTPHDTPRVVVVDDAHLLPPACIRLVNQRLDVDPDGVRLVLLTRWDLALSRLVAELLGQLTVIRGDVLRLDAEETARLVAEHARTDSPSLCEAIASRSKGWCAAVVLAARAVAAAPSRSDFVQRWQEAGPGIADLVAGEVFASLRSHERHLLLCTAAEPTVSAEEAVHLTRDETAGDVLMTLESTGLLVHRVGTAEHVRFRIHPLLLEVVRRRLTAGGVDVQQANATVRRAARLDLARGDIAVAFRRLVMLGEYDEAVDVLAPHGPHLLSEGSADLVEELVKRSGALIEERPDTWAAIATARWLSGDLDASAHWAERVVRQDATRPGDITATQVAFVRLLRARTGAEPVPAAVHAARGVLDADDPFRPLLLAWLGIAETWLCELEAAERHLGEARLMCRSRGLDAWELAVNSNLTLALLMAGRERPAHDLALDVLAGCDEAVVVVPGTRERAMITRQLVELQSLPPDAAAEPPEPLPDPAVVDLAGRYWWRLLAARVALRDGSLMEAQRVLEEPLDTPPLPAELQLGLVFERALQALLAADREVLRRCANDLADLRAHAEQKWVSGLLADLDGDLRTAADLYVRAAEEATRSQPPTGPLALVCAAQVHHYLGERDGADSMLLTAVALTQSRGLAAPFLGWSTNGTRVGVLLAGASTVSTSSWGSALRDAYRDLPAVASIFRPVVATKRELDAAVQPAVTPVLSPRENEVLRELARGSTYSDIAATLFVSENTVKTHISSLYSKLSVGRRSEALAVARKLHLL
jgi:LuxR family transcriptional regulator, maltose regulon positive regulatory protein